MSARKSVDDEPDNPVEDHSLTNDERVYIWGRQRDGSGPGRKKNSSPKQRANYRLKYAIQCKGPELIKKLFKIANSHDKMEALGAIKLLLAYGWGRPTIHIDVEAKTAKRYVAVLPPTMEHDAWMKMVTAQQSPIVVNPADSNGHVSRA
jgi:hypothetical protein